MEAATYQEELKGFLLKCAELMSVGNNPPSTVLNECFAVSNDLNTQYDQLWKKHGSIIEKYTKAYNVSTPYLGT